MASIHFHNCRNMIDKVHADTRMKRTFFVKLSATLRKSEMCHKKQQIVSDSSNCTFYFYSVLQYVGVENVP